MKRLVQNPTTGRDRPLVVHPRFNATLRTTCVATQLSGGHAENALPQLASATVNCRILPVESPTIFRRRWKAFSQTRRSRSAAWRSR